MSLVKLCKFKRVRVQLALRKNIPPCEYRGGLKQAPTDIVARQSFARPNWPKPSASWSGFWFDPALSKRLHEMVT